MLRKHGSLYWGFDVCYLVLLNEFVMLPGDLSGFFSMPPCKSV